MADVQNGLFTRAQALRAGYTSREINALIRPGSEWMVVRAGVYAERALLEALQLNHRWRLRDHAAILMSRRPCVLSHDSAARALEISLLKVDLPLSHTTHLGTGGCRTQSGVTRHRDLLPLCLERVNDLVCTSYARTALDIGRLHGYLHGLVAIDNVRNRGVPLDHLEAELARMRRHPHIARAKAALAASDAGSESPLETLGRELVRELDLGDVQTQVAVRLRNGTAVWVDVMLGRHIIECQGFIKLISIDKGGVATKPPEEVVRDQQRRRTEICAQGFGMSDLEWSDCFGPARERAKERICREYAVTEARFGRELTPEMRQFAEAHPRRRKGDLWLPASLGKAA